MNVNLQLFAKALPPREAPEKEGGKVPVKSQGKAPLPPEQKAQAPVPGEAPKALSVEERLGKVERLLGALQESVPMGGSYTRTLKEKEALRRMEKARDISLKLKEQEQEARALYPKLDLREEAKNPKFVELLKCGLDVRSAFEVIHKDEIISASMEYAAREVERMMTNKVLAQGYRPPENGGVHGPSLSRTDVKAMTRQDRKDIIRRVRMGEKITF